MSAEREPTVRSQRGTFVELVRLVLVGIFTGGGWQVAEALNLDGTQLLASVVLGSLIGYVVGGVIGRRTAVAVSVVEREFQRMSAPELLAGVLGLILGLIITALVSIFLFRLPPGAAFPTVALLGIVLTYAGYRVGRAKKDDFFGMFGLRSRSLGVQSSELNVLDTSALIDGRILQVVEAGFLTGSLLVHRGVLRELQTIADSSDHRRRARGQRGLDILHSLQRNPSVEVLPIEEDDSIEDVDSALVRLARERGGALVTGDANLARVAAAVDVPSRSIAMLAVALKPPYLPGEELTVHLAREGRDHGQAVGFLDDGTMVVVDQAQERIGSEVQATVTNVLQTSSGRMVFARLGEG
ncbi:MAG: TRAM domain-containing protein [Actinomycetota bacterium]|nr:TRAM domain-containing protein [Actinomycetota bacterium]